MLVEIHSVTDHETSLTIYIHSLRPKNNFENIPITDQIVSLLYVIKFFLT